MKGKNVIKPKAKVVPMEAQPKPELNVPSDIQGYVDSVKDNDLRSELTNHAMLLDTVVKERDGLSRYADALKKQRDEVEAQFHEVMKSQRVFVATAAMQGAISNPEISKNVRVNVNAAIEYADLLLAKLFPTEETPTADASPKA